jgi:hypothetical protein
MKTLAFYLTLLLAGFQVAAKDVVILVSPFNTQDSAAAHYSVLKDIFYDAEVGSTLKVLDGMTGNTIMAIDIPDNGAYANRKAKDTHEPFKWNALKRFFKASVTEHAHYGQLDVPRLMAQVGRYQTVSDLIAIGSALYDVSTNPRVSMKEGLVPSDGYLLNTARHNVFRTQGHETRLDTIRVHWLVFEPLPNQVHGEAVERFWHHYFNRQGASFISFGSDDVTMLELLKSNVKAIPLMDALERSGKLEMQAIRDISASLSFYDLPISREAPTASFMDAPQPLILGLVWDGGVAVDLDIYAAPKDSKTLYYDEALSPQGRFYKDTRIGVQDNREYETIEFHQPVDLLNLKLAVNAYNVEGDFTAPITGEIRIKLQERVYAKTLTFFVNKGNKGTDTEAVLASGQSTAFSHALTIKDIVNASIDQVAL